MLLSVWHPVFHEWTIWSLVALSPPSPPPQSSFLGGPSLLQAQPSCLCLPLLALHAGTTMPDLSQILHATGHCTVNCTPMLITTFCSSQVTESPRWALLAEWKKKTEWTKKKLVSYEHNPANSATRKWIEGKWAEPCSVREAGVTQTIAKLFLLHMESEVGGEFERKSRVYLGYERRKGGQERQYRCVLYTCMNMS